MRRRQWRDGRPSVALTAAVRAGRIDAVWAVHTTDGRGFAVKAYRPPVDLAARAATIRA